jgi:hypothetical protein
VVTPRRTAISSNGGDVFSLQQVIGRAALDNLAAEFVEAVVPSLDLAGA